MKSFDELHLSFRIGGVQHGEESGLFFNRGFRQSLQPAAVTASQALEERHGQEPADDAISPSHDSRV